MATEEATFDKDTDDLYLPSNWPSKYREDKSKEAVLNDYLELCSKGADKTYNLYADVIEKLLYGSGDREVIEIVKPKSSPSASRCLIAYIHGGYWMEGHYRKNSMHLALPLVDSGYHYAAVGYLSERRQLSLHEIVAQITQAINTLCHWATQHSISSVIVMGHSAGAHLAAMLMTSSQLNTETCQLLKGLVLLSGVYDLIPLIKTSINIPELGINVRSEAVKLSPFNLVQHEQITLTNLQHVMISYGEDESAAFHQQAKNFQKVLTSALSTEVKLSSYICQMRDHFDLITELMNKSDSLFQEIIKVAVKINS